MTDTSMTSLMSPFRERAERLVKLILTYDLPLQIYETRRSFKRSQDLFAEGRSFDEKSGLWTVTDQKKIKTNAGPGKSPHNWGLAMDCILDLNHTRWRREKWLPPRSPWDSQDEMSRYVWDAYGKAVVESDLVWGGNFKTLKDLVHAELPRWQNYRPLNWQDLVLRKLAGEP